jgi:predicted  nucleic acid-binding Zn-ribbon protein
LDDKIVINVLVELAGLEEELIAARALQARNRDREASLGDLQEEYRRDEDEAAKTGVETEVRFRNREGEILQTEQLLADRRARLAGLGDPRQIEALRHEITQMEQRLDALETRALELLDEAGDTNRDAETARQETREQEDRRLREQGAMRDASAQAAAAEKELELEIERLVGLLPPAVLRHVRRLKRGLDQSAVFVSGGACGGCFGQLPAQQGIAAENGSSLIQCASCSRYVVHRPWR